MEWKLQAASEQLYSFLIRLEKRADYRSAKLTHTMRFSTEHVELNLINGLSRIKVTAERLDCFTTNVCE